MSKKPNIDDIALAFFIFGEAKKEAARLPIMSDGWKQGMMTAAENLKKKLETLGVAEHIDWSES